MSIDFSLPDGAYEFRALHDTKPRQSGWDVYALQCGLIGVKIRLPKYGSDGHLGLETGRAIWLYQERRRLVEDGIAGTATQRAIAIQIAARFTEEYEIVRRLMHGQIEHESSFLLGNHSAKREAGSRDCGVCQRNDEHTPQSQGFDTLTSIRVLAKHLRTYFEKYRNLGVPVRKAWELASGAWNAPAWADRLARGETLNDAQQAHIEAYIRSTTTYVRWADA